MINTDSYYEIGAGHMFCQDYATHGKLILEGKEYHYAVVSDGCSGSKDSDIGARIMARAFYHAIRYAFLLRDEYKDENIFENVKSRLLGSINPEILNTLNTTLEAFDATVIGTVYDVSADTIYTFGWGDGNVYYRYKDSMPVESKSKLQGFLTSISYVKNAPFYLSYLKDAQREQNYETRFGKMYADIIQHLILDTHSVALINDAKSYQKFFFEKFEKASTMLTSVSVFSDGVDTYHKTDDVNTVMPKHNVFNQLTQYKTTHGEFVKRRMLMLKKFCNKDGWQHFDDVSAATISLS